MSGRLRHPFELTGDEYGRPDWHQHAACRGVGADEYFNNVVTPEALARCEGCPVRAECSGQGESERFGVWAGRLNSGQRLPKPRKPTRRRKRAETTKKKKPSSKCGSLAGYSQHKRDGEEACDACTVAHNTATREWKRRARVRRRQARQEAA